MKTTIVMRISKIVVHYESHIEFIKDGESKDDKYLLESLQDKGRELTNTYESIKDLSFELYPFINASKDIKIDERDYNINTIADDNGKEVFIVR
jgi:hypothetical protein